jgi:electron transport complex protein RnfC
MKLMPTQIRRLVQQQRWEELKGYYVGDCIECGLCEYVCPANNYLVQAIKLAKQKMTEKKVASSE